VSWLVNIILFVSACRPFHQYWQIYPDPGSELSSYDESYGAFCLVR
jgi:hypothetical protein